MWCLQGGVQRLSNPAGAPAPAQALPDPLQQMALQKPGQQQQLMALRLQQQQQVMAMRQQEQQKQQQLMALRQEEQQQKQQGMALRQQEQQKQQRMMVLRQEEQQQKQQQALRLQQQQQGMALRQEEQQQQQLPAVQLMPGHHAASSAHAMQRVHPSMFQAAAVQPQARLHPKSFAAAKDMPSQAASSSSSVSSAQDYEHGTGVLADESPPSSIGKAGRHSTPSPQAGTLHGAGGASWTSNQASDVNLADTAQPMRIKGLEPYAMPLMQLVREGSSGSASSASEPTGPAVSSKPECRHRCHDKAVCGHACCKRHLPIACEPAAEPPFASSGGQRSSGGLNKAAPKSNAAAQIDMQDAAKASSGPNVPEAEHPIKTSRWLQSSSETSTNGTAHLHLQNEAELLRGPTCHQPKTDPAAHTAGSCGDCFTTDDWELVSSAETGRADIAQRGKKEDGTTFLEAPAQVRSGA